MTDAGFEVVVADGRRDVQDALTVRHRRLSLSFTAVHMHGLRDRRRLWWDRHSVGPRSSILVVSGRVAVDCRRRCAVGVETRESTGTEAARTANLDARDHGRKRKDTDARHE